MGDLGRKLKDAMADQGAKKKPIGDIAKTIEGIVEKTGSKEPIIRGIFGENLVIVDDNGLGVPSVGDRVKVEYINYGKGAYSFGRLVEYTPRQNEVYEQQERSGLAKRLSSYIRRK